MSPLVPTKPTIASLGLEPATLHGSHVPYHTDSDGSMMAFCWGDEEGYVYLYVCGGGWGGT